jgi:branched-chain amino acid transport system substrate-binding protein
MKKIIRFFLSLFMMLALSSWAVCEGAEWKDGVVRIGVMAGMTGGFADVGQAQVMGIGDRIRYQNEEFNGIMGYKVEHLWADMKTDVPTGLRLYKRWASLEPKPIQIAVGHSSVTSQLAKDFVRDNILNISFNWNSPDIVPPGNIFWPMPGYADMVITFAKWLEKTWDYKAKGKPRVAFLRWDHPCGVAIAQYAGTYCEKKGYFDVVTDQIVPIGAIDVTTQVMQLIKSKPDFVYTMLLGSTSVAIKQSHDLGLKSQYVLRAYDTGQSYVDAAGELADGLLGVLPCARLTDTDVTGVKIILDTHKKYHPGGKIADDFSYICGWVIADLAIEAAKNVIEEKGYENLTGENVKEALKSIKDYDTKGLTHSISFGKGTLGRIGNPYARMVKYDLHNKKWVPISDWYRLPFITDKGEYSEK